MNALFASSWWRRTLVIATALLLSVLAIGSPAHAQATTDGTSGPATIAPLSPRTNSILAWKRYTGVRKGILYSGGEYHHYVEFDTSGRCGNSASVSGPLWPSPWGYVSGSNCRKYRAGYRFFGRLPDWYSPSSWKLTVNE